MLFQLRQFFTEFSFPFLNTCARMCWRIVVRLRTRFIIFREYSWLNIAKENQVSCHARQEDENSNGPLAFLSKDKANYGKSIADHYESNMKVAEYNSSKRAKFGFHPLSTILNECFSRSGLTQ